MIFFKLNIILNVAEIDPKYRDVAPLRLRGKRLKNNKQANLIFNCLPEHVVILVWAVQFQFKPRQQILDHDVQCVIQHPRTETRKVLTLQNTAKKKNTTHELVLFCSIDSTNNHNNSRLKIATYSLFGLSVGRTVINTITASHNKRKNVKVKNENSKQINAEKPGKKIGPGLHLIG